MLRRDAVRFVESSESVVIRDLKPETTEEKVLQALSKVMKDDMKMLKLVQSFEGSKTVVIKVSSHDAVLLEKVGHLVMGLVRCHVTVRKQQSRCYRCHGFSLIASACSIEDRTNLCLTRGGAGHMAKDCRSSPNCVHCQAEENVAY